MELKNYQGSSFDQTAKAAGFESAAAARAAGHTLVDVNTPPPSQGATPPPINPTPDIPTRYPTTDAYGEILKGRADKSVDPVKIQEEERARIQAQIDAINNYWSSAILPELNQEATGRLGQARGLQATGGLLQSPRGVAMTQGTQLQNTRIQRAERAKIDAQIAGLYDKADQRAIDRADKETTLARQDQDAYFKYLKDNQASAREDLTTLFAGGISPDDLKERDPDKYAQMLVDANMDEFMADSIYNQNKPKTAQVDYQYAWKGNSLVAYGQDPATGEVVTKTYDANTLDIPQGVNPDFITDKSNNMMYWYDKDNPQTDADGNLVMRPVKSPSGGSVMGAKATGNKNTPPDEDTVNLTTSQKRELNNQSLALGLDFDKALNQNMKATIFTQLTAGERRDFLKALSEEIKSGQSSPDPENYLIQWAEEQDAKKSNKSTTSDEEFLNKLNEITK